MAAQGEQHDEEIGIRSRKQAARKRAPRPFIRQGQDRASEDLVATPPGDDVDRRACGDAMPGDGDAKNRNEEEAATSKQFDEQRDSDVELDLDAQAPQMAAALRQMLGREVGIEQE